MDPGFVSNLIELKEHKKAIDVKLGSEFPSINADSAISYEKSTNKAYITGGGGTPEETHSSFMINLRERDRRLQFKKLSNMNQGRLMHSSCILRSRLFVFCGLDGYSQEETNTVEALDTSLGGTLW